MEEDIKRINCLIERCKQCKLNECITCDICWSEVQAIENLINRNKKLEENNKYLKMCTIGAEPLLRVLKSGYIEKSKVKEKIEELKEKYHNEYLTNYYGVKQPNTMKEFKYKIQVLEELLEEKE